MPVRTSESLLNEAICPDAKKRAFLKQCATMVDTFTEDQLREEMAKVESEIKRFGEKGESKQIKEHIKKLNAKLKPFKTVLY